MDFKPFEKRVYLSSPTMHGEELQSAGWQTTVQYCIPNSSIPEIYLEEI